MAEIVWTEPALAELEAIADYIAIENPAAAGAFVKRVFDHIDKPAQHPGLGVVPEELEGSRHRHIVEPPCRVFCRHSDNSVFILHVMRSERLVRVEELGRREEQT